MEYFAKFTRRIATPKKTAPTGTTQLAKFEKAWKTVQSVCYYQSKWRGMPVSQTPLPAQLGIIVDLLVQEDIRQADMDDSTTGACMEYLLGNSILDELVKLAGTDAPVGVRGVVISNLSTFVNLTEDKLLVQKAVHNPILELLRSYLVQEIETPPEAGGVSQSVASLFNARQHAYDDDFVDFMYAICSKIRGEPMLLNIFFQDRRWLKSIEQRSTSTESIGALGRSIDSLRSSSSGQQQGTTYEFLLFSHLLRFIHVEGRAGDTARTSLLFLLELATTEIMASTGGSTALERFILEDSGFAAILSATLGALYSQLPRSVTISAGPAAVVPESFPSYSADLQNAIESSIFTSSSGARGSLDRWPEDRGAVSTSTPEFRARLASFAHLLGFIQEVLYRCPSQSICDEVLKNMRNNFLQAILYPSLLESSDTDGSSVAVMRYLEAMLQVARHESLVSTIMDFLTEESSAADVHSASSSTTASSSPGASQQQAQATTRAEPMYLPFTLRDLIHTNMQSSVSSDAVISALNLLRLILSKHCRYSPRLIEVERVQPSGTKNGWTTNCTVAIDVHRQELEMYAKLMMQLESSSSGSGSSGKRGRGGSEGQVLHIPWRQDAGQRGVSRERPRSSVRSMVPESFSIGYDEYLEDAALDWDAHEAYHAELDALLAVQSARAEAARQLGASPAAAPIDEDVVMSTPGPSSRKIGRTKQRAVRPRKYSEAVMMPTGGKDLSTTLPSSRRADTATAVPSGRPLNSEPKPAHPDSTSRRGVHLEEGKHAKYNVKQSDPIVRVLMSLLTKYFAQPRECNLALTGVLAALVGCPYRTLDLWLGFNMASLLNGVLMKPWNVWLDNLRSISDDKHDGSAGESDSEGEDDPRGTRRFGGAPAAAIMAADASKFSGLDQELQDAVRALPAGATPPSLYLVIGGLVQQAVVLRNEVPDFARRLKRARNALMGIVEDVNDLDEELENTANSHDVLLTASASGNRNRDRGLSSASLDQTRGTPVIQGSAHSPVLSAASHRNRSDSVNTHSVHSTIAMDQTQDAHSSTAGESAHGRMRANSGGHMSDIASTSSEIASLSGRAGPPTISTANTNFTSGGGSPHASSIADTTWHALNVPPANANIAEFLENVIILQESIKEIIARVQVRRENGGDEDAIF